MVELKYIYTSKYNIYIQIYIYIYIHIYTYAEIHRLHATLGHKGGDITNTTLELKGYGKRFDSIIRRGDWTRRKFNINNVC